MLRFVRTELLVRYLEKLSGVVEKFQAELNKVVAPTGEIWDPDTRPGRAGEWVFNLASVDGHGERSRSPLLLKSAGTGTMLILRWLFKFGS